MKWIEGQVTHI